MFEFGVEWYHYLIIGIVGGFALALALGLVSMAYFPSPVIYGVQRIPLVVPPSLP
jgi:hypothetical protein